MPPDSVRQRLGSKYGPQMVRVQTGAANLTFNLICDYPMDCEARKTGIINAAHPQCDGHLPAHRRRIRPSVAGCRMRSKDEVTSMSGSNQYFGGWFLAQGEPLNLLGHPRELARAVIKEGGCISTESPVQQVISRDGKWSARGAVNTE